MTCIGALLAVVLVALAATPSDAILCATKRGALAVRIACEKKETAVDPARLAGTAPAGTPGEPGRSFARIRALDANGTFIGWLNAAGDIVLRAGDRAFILLASAAGFRENDGLYYEAPGCLGPGLVVGDDELVRRIPVLGTTAYAPTAPFRTVTVLSTRYPTTEANCTGNGGTYDPSTGWCCGPYSSELTAGDPTPIDLGGFVPPFGTEVLR